jgi:formylglycine-generating enzyme required for sulfatase activity
MKISINRDIHIELVKIPSGTFLMGKNKVGEISSVQHKVTITEPFYMGKYPVTQEQFYPLLDPNLEPVFASMPVTNVSWYNACLFCTKLTIITGKTVRLPTEAEWEYACRAGTTTDYHSDDLDLVGWYETNSDDVLHAVGLKQPNAWGLYDMHGNVWEWCQDWYRDYPIRDQTDPQGPAHGTCRVVRGGCYSIQKSYCASYRRGKEIPNIVNDYTGFRVVLSL